MKTQFLSSLVALFIFGVIHMNAQCDHQHHGHIWTKAYAATDPSAPLTPYEFERRSLNDDDILIEILYSGICHSDIHTVKGDWGQVAYPLVPGHEIVGKVVKAGKNVTKFKVGDYAGVGCMVNSCGECYYCKAGEEQYCTKGATYTYSSKEGDGYTQGGYSNNIVVREAFAITIPKDAPLEKIAPLLCAGITTYSPLKYNKVKAGDKVAVAGFGGLGHMAVQYAVKMGAEVTVFDITEDKREAAAKLGAVRYVNTKNADESKDLEGTFDLILSTIPVSFSVESYLSMLKVDGTMVLIGVPAIKDMPSVQTWALQGRKKIYGALIGGIRETQEMMDYSVANNIYPMVEIIPIQQVNEAYKNVLAGKVQFRYVIDISSLR